MAGELRQTAPSGAGTTAGDASGRGVLLTRANRLLALGIIGAIRIYQRTARWRPSVCRYQPTCSQYAIDAYKEFGFFKGTVLAGWRLLRCNPWSRGGVDYARDQKVFK